MFTASPQYSTSLTHHYAPDTIPSVLKSFNEQGFCIKHPDIVLRQKKMLGGWNIIQRECPRCAEEWKEQRDTAIGTVNVVFENIEQIYLSINY